MREFIIWVWGSVPFEIPFEIIGTEGEFQMRVIRPPLWEMAPTGDFFSLMLGVHTAPCVFHRIAQRLVFGIKYRRSKNNERTKGETQT